MMSSRSQRGAIAVARHNLRSKSRRRRSVSKSNGRRNHKLSLRHKGRDEESKSPDEFRTARNYKTRPEFETSRLIPLKYADEPMKRFELASDILRYANENGNSDWIYERTDDLLGVGGYGFVFKCRRMRRQETNTDEEKETVAIKFMLMDESSMSEIFVMQYMNHPNVLKLLDVLSGPFYDYDRQYIGVVMPLAKSNLTSLIETRQPFEKKLSMIRDIMCGMKYIHDSGFQHLDFKPQNVLVMEDERLCIADFGLTRPADALKGDPNSIVTVDHRAPELLCGDTNYDGFAVDKWALGVVICNILFQDSPFLFSSEKVPDEFFALYKNHMLSQRQFPDPVAARFMSGIYQVLIVPQITESDAKKQELRQALKSGSPQLEWILDANPSWYEKDQKRLEEFSEGIYLESAGKYSSLPGAMRSGIRLIAASRTNRWYTFTSSALQTRLILEARTIEWQEITDLVLGFLNLIPANRPSLSSAIEMPLFKDYNLCIPEMDQLSSETLCKTCASVPIERFQIDYSSVAAMLEAEFQTRWKESFYRGFVKQARLSFQDTQKARIYATFLLLEHNFVRLPSYEQSREQIRKIASEFSQSIRYEAREIDFQQLGEKVNFYKVLIYSCLFHLAVQFHRYPLKIYLDTKNRITIENDMNSISLWGEYSVLSTIGLDKSTSRDEEKLLVTAVKVVENDYQPFERAMQVIGSAFGWNIAAMLRVPRDAPAGQEQ